MKTAFRLVLSLGGAIAIPLIATGQPTSELGIKLHPGLTISGTVGTVYSIESADDPARTNAADGWRCLEFLQLPSSPWLWFDHSAAVGGARFYRARIFEPLTNLVFVPPGSFRMGSPTNEWDSYPASENPQTVVVISRGFWMGKCEVTQGEYLGLIGVNPSYFNGQPVAGHPQYGIDLNRPVERVSWDDATNFCAKLTDQHVAARLIPPGSRYRLPTAAEWQYACRAWTSTRFGYGDDPDYSSLAEYAWFKDNSDGMPHAVGQKRPNPWGLYDMHGNVYEWCQDWYQGFQPFLPGGIVVDPKGPPSGSSRLMGGGAYLYPGRACRSASLQNYCQPCSADQIGFRVVLSAAP